MPLGPEQKQALEKQIRAFVGKPIGPPRRGRDAVNEPMIRQWCEVTGDESPIHWDPAAAKESVHGSIVAPPLMLGAWTMQGWEMRVGYDEPRNEEHRLHKILTAAGYTRVLGTDPAQGFTPYLRPGDEVTANTVIAEISEEKATGAGVGYFITTHTTFTDQDGAEVGFEKFRVLKFIPSQPQAAASDSGGAAAAQKPSRIKPPMGHDNAWWWDHVREQGEIPIQRCKECQLLRHPPRPMCSACGSMEWDHVAASGRGAVHTFTVIHYPQFPGYEFPIIAALIDLEEGTRLMSSLTDCKPEDAKIGMPVEAVIKTDEDGFALPVFRPAK
jgi:uncharacterized OB-fold protein/acyl dehydratase